jgi:type 1 fimbriae regulatory protein FimB/type 1 fimbriae regulatory protein FimE
MFRQRYPISAQSLLAYRHGLRVAELCSLRWEQVDFEVGLLHVHRVKHGIPSVHPLRAPELRALRQLHRESEPSPYLFTTERGSPIPNPQHDIVSSISSLGATASICQ